MIEEIKTDNNCIVKAFENNPISILEEDLDNKKIYCFKANDIAKILDILKIDLKIKILKDGYGRECTGDNSTLLKTFPKIKFNSYDKSISFLISHIKKNKSLINKVQMRQIQQNQSVSLYCHLGIYNPNLFLSSLK